MSPAKTGGFNPRNESWMVDNAYHGVHTDACLKNSVYKCTAGFLLTDILSQGRITGCSSFPI
jgi:hypothetical protein